MAHFAKLGENNIVLGVQHLATIKNMTDGGIETESIGVAYLKEHSGHETWKQCSYNTSNGAHLKGGTPFRGNYPGVGWYYDSTNNIFHPPRPTDKDGDSCASWTLNTSTGMWDPPIAKPDGGTPILKAYDWDESVYQADSGSPKTLGWVLTHDNS